MTTANMAVNSRENLSAELHRLKAKRDQLCRNMRDDAQGHATTKGRKHRSKDSFDDMLRKFDQAEREIRKIECLLNPPK